MYYLFNKWIFSGFYFEIIRKNSCWYLEIQIFVICLIRVMNWILFFVYVTFSLKKETKYKNEQKNKVEKLNKKI